MTLKMLIFCYTEFVEDELKIVKNVSLLFAFMLFGLVGASDSCCTQKTVNDRNCH